MEILLIFLMFVIPGAMFGICLFRWIVLNKELAIRWMFFVVISALFASSLISYALVNDNNENTELPTWIADGGKSAQSRMTFGIVDRVNAESDFDIKTKSFQPIFNTLSAFVRIWVFVSLYEAMAGLLGFIGYYIFYRIRNKELYEKPDDVVSENSDIVQSSSRKRQKFPILESRI